MRRSVAIMVVTGIVSSAVFCGPSRLAGAPGPIRMGYLGVSSDAGIFIALDKGYFTEQGLSISLERFGVGADQMALLGAGRLDIASGGPSPTLFNAVARGLPIRMVADKGSYQPGYGFGALVVRKVLVDSGQFKGLSDLKGRIIALPNPASINEFQARALLRKAGLGTSDVRVEYIAFADQPAAMVNGKIDAALMVEPFATAVDAQGIGKIVATGDQILPGLQVSAIYYNVRWAYEHAEDARRWMVAYVRGLRYYNAALKSVAVREEVITIMAAHTSITSRAVWDKMIWPGLRPDGLVDIRSLLDYERWLLSERQISQFLTPEQFLDLSFVRHAVRVLTSYGQTIETVFARY